MSVRLPSWARQVGTPETGLQTAVRLRQAKADASMAVLGRPSRSGGTAASNPAGEVMVPGVVPPTTPQNPGGPTVTTYAGPQTFNGFWSNPAGTTPDTGSAASFGGTMCSILRAAGFPCNAAGVALAVRAGINLVGGNGGGGSNLPVPGCPSGTVMNPNNGVCESPGSPGDMSTPGGPSYSGAQMGIFGAPAVAPIVVGQYGPNPIRKCPAATVLGMDNLCYAKGSIPRKYRKWKPSRRPPVSAADAMHIRKAASAEQRVARLARQVGFKVTNK